MDRSNLDGEVFTTERELELRNGELIAKVNQLVADNYKLLKFKQDVTTIEADYTHVIARAEESMERIDKLIYGEES